jgi:ATP-dependent Lon protease
MANNKEISTPTSVKKESRKESKKDENKYASDDSSGDEFEEDYSSSSDNEDDEMDKEVWNKFLGKLFPSKYIKEKANQLKKMKDKEKQKNKLTTKENESKKKPIRRKEQKFNFYVTNLVKAKKSKHNDEEEYNEEDSEDDSDYDSEDYDSEDDSDYDEEDDDEYDEDEDEDEDEDDEDEEDDEDDDDDDKKSKKKPIKKTKKSKEEEELAKLSINDKISSEKQLLEVLEKSIENCTHSKSIKRSIHECKVRIKELEEQKKKSIKKISKENTNKFKKLLRNKSNISDKNYFAKLEPEKQLELMTECEKINSAMTIDKPYRISLLESSIPVHFKSAAMKRINALRYIEPGGGEYYKMKNWIDTFMKIPFDTYKTLPVCADDGVDKCHEFMEQAKKTLDDAVYGLNDAKMQIMQMIGQFITNPTSVGSAIAIKGPMGTGKTTLVKEGISKILNRDFSFIALGGATDSSVLEGHSYTYEGSTWGQIVEILIKSKCMNPVIYFDELDKISDTPKGEEITGILTHLTDTSQNSQFHDKYFSEIDFDLSKCLFIFSYNDESRINPILRDRMYRIQTKGYDSKQKCIISQNYLLPCIRKQVKFDDGEIIIKDEVIKYMIENYTNKEDGMRNLKRCLEIVHTKLNLYRLMKPDTNLFEDEMSLEVKFPFEVTTEIVNKLIKQDKEINVSARMLYI